MTLQTAKNTVVNFKVETTYTTPAGPGGGETLRKLDSPGLNLAITPIRSGESRPSGMRSMGRNGSRNVPGSFNAEALQGAHDTIHEAWMRSTWAAPLVIDEGTSGAAASITTTTSTIVGNAGSWITAGLRVGDVIRLTDHVAHVHNGQNLRIRALTATVITVHGTPLVLDAGADSAYTITRGKKIINGAAPVRRTFEIEQNNVDIDASQVFGGCRYISAKLNGTPDDMATWEFGVLGANMRIVTGAAAPYYTAPTTYDGDPLVFADARINLNGVDIAVATSFELMNVIEAATTPVIGSVVSPDVFDNDGEVSGSFTMLREDFDRVSAYEAETEFELHILLRGASGESAEYLSVFVPRVKFTGVTAQLGGTGGMLETVTFQTGPKRVTAGYDASTITLCTAVAS